MLRRGPEHETRQIRYNSGVYTAHYARWYNVLELHEPIRSVRNTLVSHKLGKLLFSQHCNRLTVGSLVSMPGAA